MIFDRYKTCIIPFVCPFDIRFIHLSHRHFACIFFFFSFFFNGTNNNITCKSMWRSVSFCWKRTTEPKKEIKWGRGKTKITQLVMFFFLFRCEQRLSCLKIVNIATGHACKWLFRMFMSCTNAGSSNIVHTVIPYFSIFKMLVKSQKYSMFYVAGSLFMHFSRSNLISINEHFKTN